MRYTTFGRTGLRVSRIGLGGFPFGGRNLSAGWDPWTAEGRRTARFQPFGHIAGPMEASPEERNPDFPFTLDLRRPPSY